MTQALLRFNTRAFVSVKKHRNYRLFFLGQTVSLPGTWIQRFAQAWLVYTLTHHSAIAVGVLAFAQFLPFTLFSLIVGVFVDRFDPRRIVLATQAASMTLASIMAAITLSGVVQPWHVYVIGFLAGTVQVLDAPARQQLTYRMVGRNELQNAVALNSVSSTHRGSTARRLPASSSPPSAQGSASPSTPSASSRCSRDCS